MAATCNYDGGCAADRPDAIIEADAGALTGLVYGGGNVAEASRSGDIEVEGDEEVIERFPGLTPLSVPPHRLAAGTWRYLVLRALMRLSPCLLSRRRSCGWRGSRSNPTAAVRGSTTG